MADADFPVEEARPYAELMTRMSQGVIAFQRCVECSAAIHYPRVLCPVCGATKLVWEEALGDGVVYSSTFVHGRDGAPGHAIVLVDLVEGFRVMGAWTGGAPDPGTEVKGAVALDEDDPRLIFERAELT